jgi:protein-L-isoaspartate(D-aspartate) O-methyltransferase
MAWRCGSTSNYGLVANLKSAGIIESDAVLEAMKAVDRGNYVIEGTHPYADSPQYIGYDATISAPHMHAHALELIKDSVMGVPGYTGAPRVLDVGCGSGYLVTAIARMSPRAQVIGIEYVKELTDLSEANVRKEDGDLLDSGRVLFHTRNGWVGMKEYAPFDAIHVGAAADGYPMELMEQLKVGGKMVVPVGKQGGSQALMEVTRVDEGTGDSSFRCLDVMGVQYVPLVNGTYKPSGKRFMW